MSNDPATEYALSVVSGSIVAGPYVRAACQRHLNDLSDGHLRGLVWDVEKANRAIRFFAHVLTVEVEEQDEDGEMQSRAVPFILQPWQCFIIGSLFGWLNEKGVRRFRRAYTEIGKGNGKSPMAAGIGHYMLVAQKKLRAEIYSAATDKDQASILFRDAVEMYDRSPNLKKRLRQSGQNPVWQLTHLDTSSYFKPISSEKKGKSGIRPYCALIDEIHEHADDSVIEMMRAGTKGNKEALIFEITNSGYDRKSVCHQEHAYSIEVVTGVKENDAWFAYVASLDEDDDPFEDESCWIKANPNLGVSIQPEYIREQVVEAKGMGHKEGKVRRLNFCEWTEAANSAIPRAIWEQCKGEVSPEELCQEYGQPFGGLDLSRARDLTCLTLTWLLESKPDAWRFASKTWFWTPEETLAERSKTDRAPYEAWVKAGFMEAVPGPRVSYSWVADALASICAKYDPKVIGCDKYGLEQLQEQLNDKGISLPCVVHPQGFQTRVIETREKEKLLGKTTDTGADEISLWMPDSILKLEAALTEKRIIIEPNPVMEMCSAAVVYEQNRIGHRMFNKDKATSRIDGMVSLAMSIGMATLPVAPKKKYQILILGGTQ